MCFGKFTSSNKKFEWKSVPDWKSRKNFVRRWHGHSGIGFDLVLEWYGRVGKFVSGMTIREKVTSALLAVPFTNIRGWSGLFTNVREWTRFVGGIEQLHSVCN